MPSELIKGLPPKVHFANVGDRVTVLWNGQALYKGVVEGRSDDDRIKVRPLPGQNITTRTRLLDKSVVFRTDEDETANEAREPIPPIHTRMLPEEVRKKFLQIRTGLFDTGTLSGNEADLWAWRICNDTYTKVKPKWQND